MEKRKFKKNAKIRCVATRGHIPEINRKLVYTVEKYIKDPDEKGKWLLMLHEIDCCSYSDKNFELVS
jgi:hypothetical protein